MNDEELKELSDERSSLTETGQELLGAELSRRGLVIDPVKLVDPEELQKNPATICQFRDLPEALLAKGFLQSAGIESFLMDETTVRMDWLWSNMLGGIKLCVKAEDAEAATQILNQEIPNEFNVEGIGSHEQPHCPQCQSLDISYEDMDRHITYAITFGLGVPIPITRRRWKCNSCGDVWLPSNTDSNQSG